ncbi:MAG: hypothetical protein ABIJ97_13925, partial [Bacteroidota bacterium]
MKNHAFSFLITIILLLIATVAFSQSWDKTKPNILFATDKNGNVSDVKVGIGTSTPVYPLDVKGQIIVDSIHVTNFIKVGNNTLYINFPNPNDFSSDNGEMHFVNQNILTPFDIKIGIGTTSPQSKIHLYDPAFVYEQFTNAAFSNGSKLG